MNKRIPHDAEGIRGAGGGAASASARTPVEAPNSLRSAVKGKILDLIAYGPVRGLVDGLKSVYLDDTAIQNKDGSFNFDGIDLTQRFGTPDQDYVPGFNDVENAIDVATEVLFDNPPVRSVSNNDADAVLITVQVAALASQADNGDTVGASVSVYVDVQVNGGAWTLAYADTISGKTTAPYPRTYRVDLRGFPSGERQIRVRRGNKESVVQKLQDQLNWASMTEVIDVRLAYPNMAMVGIAINSQYFGSDLPARSYDMYLSIIKVPSNYDPITRVYTGLWDGTFKNAWSDNPAWCFYDLATHPVIGAGLKDVDKWECYRIGQYCDGMVPDGFGNLEPRFTCNTLFSEQEDAVTALNTFASCFRGMSYWGTNTMVPVADMPSAPIRVVGPANVKGGDFEYVGTSMRERHSVAVVMWNDPDDAYKAKPEIYEDADSIQAFGWKETRVTAVACSSRGQARRLAKWILYSERMETQTLSFEGALDLGILRPGDIIEVADPDYQGARMSGRLTLTGKTKVTLDQSPTDTVAAVGGSWYLSVAMPNGTIAKQPISSFNGNVVNLLGALPDTPVPGAIWALSSAGLNLPQFRVVSVGENGERNTYTVSATEYDPLKYNAVEFDLHLPSPPTSTLPTGPVAPPLDLSFRVYKYQAGDGEHQGLTVSWTPPKDVRVETYVLDTMPPNESSFGTVYNGPGNSFDIKDAMGGQWTIRVRAVSSIGVASQYVTRTVQIAQLLLPVPPDSVTVQEKTFSITLAPQSAYPTQNWEFWRSLGPLNSQDLIETNATQMPTGTYLVDTGLRSGTIYYYWIRGVNQYGKSAWYAVQAETTEDFEDILAATLEDIKNGAAFQFINGEIIDTVTEQVGDKLAEIQEQIDNIADALAYDHEVAYEEGQVVRQGRNLYSAIVAVPADPDNTGAYTPPNPAYWKDVGDILEEANGLATAIEQVQIDLTNLDDVITSSVSRLDGLSAAVRDQQDGTGDLQGAVTAWKARADYVARIKVVATTAQATAERFEQLSVEFEDTKASFSTLETLVATENAAMAQRITDLEVEVGDNLQAKFQEEQTLRIEGDQVNATALQTVSAKAGENTAAIQTQSQVVANLNGKITASYGVKLQLTADGRMYAAGMGLDITSQNGITQSNILFQADKFAVINVADGSVTVPFFIQNSKVWIQAAMIQDASINFAKISDTIQSNNYVPNSTGWRLTKAGGFEINGLVAGGGRVQITNQVVMVFDPNGTLRVRLGIWG